MTFVDFFLFKGFAEALQEARSAAGYREPSSAAPKTSDVCLSAVVEKSPPKSCSMNLLSGTCLSVLDIKG